MHAEKCPQCGLVNLVSDFECRRCGRSLMVADKLRAKRGPREAARRPSSFLWTLLFLTLIGSIAFYLVNGVEDSIGEVGVIPGTPAPAASAGPQTRAAAETKAKHAYAAAIKDSPGLRASQERVDDMNKLMRSSPER